MIVDILVRSHFRDFGWLRLCLASIDHFVEGYRHVILVVPGSSLDRLPSDIAPPSLPLRLLTCAEFADDYVGQQLTKLRADDYSDADYLAHVDSDCAFLEETSMRRFFDDARPIHVYRADTGRRLLDGWRESIQECLGHRTSSEFMVAMPAIYPRWIYDDLRATCQARLAMTIEACAATKRGDQISEFNLLGSHAWHSHHEAFEWVEVNSLESSWPCRQFWGRRGMTEEVRHALPEALRRYVR